MIGGRCSVDYERLIRFNFPEKPGALKRFLETLGETVHFTFHQAESFAVSGFHYKHGGIGDVGRVLASFVVAPEVEHIFESFLEKLNYPYIDETGNQAYDLFLREREKA